MTGIYRNIGREKTVGPSNWVMGGLCAAAVLLLFVDIIFCIKEGSLKWLFELPAIVFLTFATLIWVKFERTDKKRELERSI